MIYWEDIPVGGESDFGTYEVTREEMLEFARKYDPQPFHLSDAAAAQTHFGRLSASGWHTAAMTMALISRKIVSEEQARCTSPGRSSTRLRRARSPKSARSAPRLSSPTSMASRSCATSRSC
jgi:acyl dehydratase